MQQIAAIQGSMCRTNWHHTIRGHNCGWATHPNKLSPHADHHLWSSGIWDQTLVETKSHYHYATMPKGAYSRDFHHITCFGLFRWFSAVFNLWDGLAVQSKSRVTLQVATVTFEDRQCKSSSLSVSKAASFRAGATNRTWNMRTWKPTQLMGRTLIGYLHEKTCLNGKYMERMWKNMEKDQAPQTTCSLIFHVFTSLSLFTPLVEYIVFFLHGFVHR